MLHCIFRHVPAQYSLHSCRQRTTAFLCGREWNNINNTFAARMEKKDWNSVNPIRDGCQKKYRTGPTCALVRACVNVKDMPGISGHACTHMIFQANTLK
jgi:hypothetical protein